MMSSVDMEMDDIFEERGEGDLEEDLHQSAGMPDLDLNIPDGDDVAPTQGDGEGDAEVLARLQGAAKKKTMKPQPKLDPARLKGDRGLPILPKVFEKIKFRGRGHEAEDLQLMMRKLEHWGHRLFPKLPFDDLLERLEKLGSKKEVQNTVKRIRLDMPLLDEDYTSGQQAGDEQENAEAANPQEPVENAEDLFDELIRQEREAQEDRANAEDDGISPPASPVYSRRAAANTDPVNRGDSPTPAPAHTPVRNSVGTPNTPVSESQKERMERNRRMALEKRAKRLGMTLAGYEDHLAQQKKASLGTTTPTASKEADSQHTEAQHTEGGQQSQEKNKETEQSQGEYSLAEPSVETHLSLKGPSNSGQNSLLGTDDKDTMQTVDEIMDTLEEEDDNGSAAEALVNRTDNVSDSSESHSTGSKVTLPLNHFASSNKEKDASENHDTAGVNTEEESVGTLLLEDVTPDRESNLENTVGDKAATVNNSPVKSLKSSLEALEEHDKAVRSSYFLTESDHEDVEMTSETKENDQPAHVESISLIECDDMDISDNPQKLSSQMSGSSQNLASESQKLETADDTCSETRDDSQSLSILS